MSRGRVLAVDDEKNIRHLLVRELAVEGFDVHTAKTGEEGLKLLREHHFQVLLLDIKLPKMNGIEVLRNVKHVSPLTKVIMITGYGDIQTAVESMKLGARDYITKPFKLSELVALINQAIVEDWPGQDAAPGMSGIVLDGDVPFVACPSGPMQQVYDLVRKVAPTDATVLIQGETGVGKDVIAALIHGSSHRKDKPFIVVDCGLLNQNLAESELYGHGKGAFSGASELKQGLVERSHEGSIFFDEIGNIELEMQKKFLRFLETRTFRRLGETKERKVNTRIILATNLDLKEAAQKGLMRNDLLYRMDVICVRVPALRERPEDIATLAQHFLETGSPHRQAPQLSPEALTALVEYPWPGNVRELRSVMTKTMICSGSDVIIPGDLPAHVLSNRKPLMPVPKSLEDLEKEHILNVLAETGGNQSRAAEVLGINRKTLYKKIHKYRLFA